MNTKQVITGLILLFAFNFAKGQDKIITTSQETFDKWRVGLQAGGAYLLGSSAKSEQLMQDLGISKSQAEKLHKQLRNGMNYGADVHYFINEILGVGLKYSLFVSSVQMNLLIKDYEYKIPVNYSMGMNEKDYVNFVGPSVVFRHWLGNKRKFRINEELSLGYAHYRSEVRFNPYQYVFVNSDMNQYLYNMLVEGSTIGGNAQVSFDYYPLSWLSIAANLGICTMNFRTLKVSDKDSSSVIKLDKDNSQNLSRLDYSIAFRFHFK